MKRILYEGGNWKEREEEPKGQIFIGEDKSNTPPNEVYEEEKQPRPPLYIYII